MANANTTLVALGITSLLVFKANGKKADGSPLFYRRPKDGKEGIEAGYRLVVPGNVTDAQGRVTATYIAGTTGSVTDVIQARLLSGRSAQSVIITVGP